MAEAVGYGMNGLPIAKQIGFHSLVTKFDECKVVGGAAKTSGFLRRTVVNILEDGFQESLRRRGYPVEELSACMESVDNKVSDEYFHAGELEVLSNVTAAMPVIFSSKEEWDVASKEAHTFKRKRLAWPNGRTESSPSNFVFGKQVIAQGVFGVDTALPNAFDGPPVANPTSVEQCLDASKFTDERRWNAVDLTVREDIDVLEIDGGLGGLDECKEAWKATVSGSIVKYLTEERETLLGHEAGSGWAVVWTYYGIYVLKLEWDGDDRIRVIVVFCPWCKMIFAKNGVRIGWGLLTQAERATKSAYWLSTLRKLLAEPNSTLVADTSLDRPVKDNFFFHHSCVTLQYQAFDHFASNASAHELKNRVLGDALNINQPDCTDLVRTREDVSDVFGHNTRLKIFRRPEDADDRMSIDRLFPRVALQFASLEATIEEAAKSLVYSVDFKRKLVGKDVPLDSSVTGKRFNALMDAADEDGRHLLRRKLRKAFRKQYKATRKNAGNTSGNHHAPTAATIEGTDKNLKKLCESEWSGEWFFVQADGVAKEPRKKSKHFDYAEFVVPPDGAILDVEPGKEGDYDPVVFRLDRFVPNINHVSLCGRCVKPTNGPGNTKTVTCWRTTEYEIETTKGIVRYGSRKVQWVNRYHIARVRFVPVEK